MQVFSHGRTKRRYLQFFFFFARFNPLLFNKLYQTDRNRLVGASRPNGMQLLELLKHERCSERCILAEKYYIFTPYPSAAHGVYRDALKTQLEYPLALIMNRSMFVLLRKLWSDCVRLPSFIGSHSSVVGNCLSLKVHDDEINTSFFCNCYWSFD